MSSKRDSIKEESNIKEESTIKGELGTSNKNSRSKLDKARLRPKFNKETTTALDLKTKYNDENKNNNIVDSTSASLANKSNIVSNKLSTSSKLVAVE